MSVVTIEDIEPFLPAALTTQQQAMLEDLIDNVEGELALILNRPIEPTIFTAERYVVNLTEPAIYLKNSPVISIDEVVADGLAVDSGMYTMREWGLDFAGFNTLAINDPVVWTPTNAQFGWWQSPDVMTLASGDYPQGIWEISYTAGLDGANIKAIRSVLTRACRRQLGEIFQGYNMIYDSIKVEDYSVSQNGKLASEMMGSFQKGDIRLLDSLMRKNYVA